MIVYVRILPDCSKVLVRLQSSSYVYYWKDIPNTLFRPIAQPKSKAVDHFISQKFDASIMEINQCLNLPTEFSTFVNKHPHVIELIDWKLSNKNNL